MDGGSSGPPEPTVIEKARNPPDTDTEGPLLTEQPPKLSQSIQPELAPPLNESSSSPRVRRAFYGYLVDTDRYVRVSFNGFPRAADENSLAYYLREHLDSVWQIGDDSHTVRVLKLDAREESDVHMPECTNALVVKISYHFEDPRGANLQAEPSGLGSGHQCIDYDKSQAEKEATGNALRDVGNVLFGSHR
jgi:hypothetical protein